MRHGQSKANVQRIIISHPENGLSPGYGLTDLGKQQAEHAAKKSALTKDTVIYCSDFSRAKETAEIVERIIGAKLVHITQSLRERHFGEWEASDHGNYHNVWQQDAADASHSHNQVESVEAMLERTTRFILSLEEKHQNQKILLVSHGDTLQILETAFRDIEGGRHRELVPMQNAEIREMALPQKNC